MTKPSPVTSRPIPTQLETQTAMSSEWWRGGVIYQIYPRSFADSNGDGIGDLPGITAKLDYVASLGVDAIWLSPFFKSPMKDFGYDVSDYRAVDPIFGTLQDFDRLIARAHELGIKIIIDQVLSHCADAHPWFQESRCDRQNPKADWYVWAEAKADGSVPNNWLSLFGGSAWQWDASRQQFYMHNFLVSQPDLNFHHPAVQAQALEEMRFWLERGVDGFRFDTANFYFHDKLLRDNPPWTNGQRKDGATPDSNPYSHQRHLYDKTQPENREFLKRVRVLLDQYGATAVGEIGDDDPFGTMANYTSGTDGLHMAYIFNLLTAEFSARHFRATIEELESRIGDGWACWSFSNHDVKRVMSRWGGGTAPESFGKMLVALLGSLRGSVCYYEGEELGLTEADIAFEDLQDPYGKTFWPEFKGRDGCRTPMPWKANETNAGFSTGKPWLPVPAEHARAAVDGQEKNSSSSLNAFRTFINWRNKQPALKLGALRFIDAPENVLAFVREHAQANLLAVFNLSVQAVVMTVPKNLTLTPLSGHGLAAELANGQIHLPPYGVFYAQIDR